MKRAILTTAGTVAGLVSVLAYSPPRATQSVAAGDAGAGLGAPPPAAAGDPSTAAPDNGAAGAVAGGRPIASASAARGRPGPAAHSSRTSRSAAAHTSAVGSRTSSSSSAPRPKAAPTSARPSSRPAPPTSHSNKPTASKSPVAAGPQDFTGPAMTYQYGTLQVAIRVQNGKITDAWAVTYPTGSSLPYSQMAIPILRSQTLAAQSAHIAGATGATLTSTSWKSSLAAALAKAGL